MKLDEPIKAKRLLLAFGLMNEKKYDQAEKALTEGLKEAETARDLVLQGLHYSAFGVLSKLKKDFRKAWKYYEQAEKLIPDDLALKIISARLLVEYFGQYDTVIRKMEKAAKMEGADFVFLHQILTTQGLAYLRAGNKKKAAECLKKAMGKNFDGIQSMVNLDLKLVGEMTAKKVDPPLCRAYLNGAATFAKKTKEGVHEKIIKRLLDLFPK